MTTVANGQQLHALLNASRSVSGGSLLVGAVAYRERRRRGMDSEDVLASVESAISARTRSPAMRQRIVWKALPGTRDEIEAIAKLWQGPSGPVILTGPDADETAMRRWMPESGYIHLATHGFFADEEFRSAAGHHLAGERLFGASDYLMTAGPTEVVNRNPLILSGVVLAGVNLPPRTDAWGLPTGEDGILTAEEIAALDLRGTELVVLSACDTGLGLVAGGEGVFGLQRAFHLAGARNVVASLWKVDDEATAALMGLFYHKLWQENKPPIVALREAQLALYRHPERISQLASSRGPDFAKTVPLVDGGARKPGNVTADTRLWAAFVLSGAGR